MAEPLSPDHRELGPRRAAYPAADRECLAFNDYVWPAVHISKQNPRYSDDFPGLLIDQRPTTAEGIRAKEAAAHAMEDAVCYGGGCRDDFCSLYSSMLVDMAASARMLLGEDADPIVVIAAE